MEVFSAAPHEDILLLLIQMGALLFAARAMGELVQRIGQPSVVGELLAGIILGPSLLSGFVPFLGEWLIPQTPQQGYLIEVVSMIGAIFLLLLTGLETDVKLIRRHARTAVTVSFSGILVTFGSGFLLAHFLPGSLLADPNQRLVFQLFIAVAMSISAIPVIAKVLMDLDLIRRDIGQAIIAAGMIDDTIGWMMLSTVAGLAAGQAVGIASVLKVAGSIVLFMVFSFTLGRWAILHLLRFVQDKVNARDAVLTLVMVLTFIWGALTTALNFEAIFGAFIIGIIFGTMPRLPVDVVAKIESITLGIFTPIFFGIAGLKVNILNLFTPSLMLITLLVIAVASLGKYAGAYMGARIAGKGHWYGLAFAGGLNARGAMEIIIATIGLRLGILSQEMYSIIVIMAMVTSMMAPNAMRWALRRMAPDEEEERRLEQERLRKDSLVAGIHRVLMPVRMRPDDSPGEAPVDKLKAELLRIMSDKAGISVTLMIVLRKTGGAEPLDELRAKANKYLKELGDSLNLKDLTTRVVISDDISNAIIDEAQKSYELVLLGASEPNPETRELFSPLVDELVRGAPCPTLVLSAPEDIANWKPEHILVPTNGAQPAKHAAELAFLLAGGDENSEVTVLNAVTDRQTSELRFHTSLGGNLEAFGREIVDELARLGDAMSVRTRAKVKIGDTAEEVIIRCASDHEIDLIIIGTSVRPGSTRLYLGPRTENVIANAPCPVLIFNS